MQVSNPMLLAIFGNPVGLTQWVMSSARQAAEIIQGRLSTVVANSLEDLRAKWSKRDQVGVLFHSDTPNRELIDLFVRIPGTAVIVTEPIATVANFVGLNRSIDPQSALRVATRSACTLVGLFKRSDLWHVDMRIRDLSLNDFADELTARILPQASPTHVEQIKAKFAAVNPNCGSVGQAVDAFVERSLGANTDSFLKGAYLTPELTGLAGEFEECLRGGSQQMTWPANVFVRTSDLNYIEGPLDLVGPARVLIAGHSLSLPIGRWKATAEIAVSGNLSGNKIRSDIFAENRPVTIGIMRLPAEGAFSYQLDFECLDPSFPLIFRIAIMEGAIEGELELRRVHFERIQ